MLWFLQRTPVSPLDVLEPLGPSPELADPLGRATSPKISLNIIRYIGNLDFQTSRNLKGEKSGEHLELLCQRTMERWLQKQGTAPMEEGLKI